VGDWPIKEYLQLHFRNQRCYKRHRSLHLKTVAHHRGKILGNYVKDINDIFDFCSAGDESSSDDGGNDGSNESSDDDKL
jgi:hypothetical protein